MSYLLKVQEYLKNHSLNQLSKEHGVNHRIYGHKMSLNYDQIEAKENDPIAQECRGLVLGHEYDFVDPNDVFGHTEILAWPFKRFFNYGQDSAARINFDKASFFEKADGTLIIFYWDHHINKWCAATRSVPEANLPIDGFKEHTFSTLFEKAIEETTNLSYSIWLKQSNLDKNITYIFELCTPLNKIVVQYNDYKVWLIGMRNKTNGKEYSIKNYGPAFAPLIPVCTSYNFSNVNDMINFVESCNPLEHEGIVVCDDLFRRIKVKNPAYVAYNRINDITANSPRAVMQIVLDEKLDDLSSVLKGHIVELAKIYQKNLKIILNDFREKYDLCFKNVIELGTMSDKVKQKTFAALVKENKLWLSPAMCIYTGRSKDLRHYFEQQKNPNGEYKKSLLELLINMSDKLEKNV